MSTITRRLLAASSHLIKYDEFPQLWQHDSSSLATSVIAAALDLRFDHLLRQHRAKLATDFPTTRMVFKHDNHCNHILPFLHLSPFVTLHAE
jgi:hypothetical protein